MEVTGAANKEALRVSHRPKGRRTERQNKKKKKETVRYLLGGISTLTLHIDLTEQRRRHTQMKMD